VPSRPFCGVEVAMPAGPERMQSCQPNSGRSGLRRVYERSLILSKILCGFPGVFRSKFAAYAIDGGILPAGLHRVAGYQFSSWDGPDNTRAFGGQIEYQFFPLALFSPKHALVNMILPPLNKLIVKKRIGCAMKLTQC